MKSFSPHITRIALISFLTLSLLTVSFAQTPPPKRKKLKDFGSSLKRLKWNPEKNAVEQPASSAIDEGDVIRIDTSLVSCELYTVVPGVKLLGLTPEEQLEKSRIDQETRWAGLIGRLPQDRQEKLKERLRQVDKSNELINLKWMTQRQATLQSALAGVATLTGGWTEFLETPEQAEDIYARIFSDINQRYIVGYYPANKERDGKRRKIDFEVKGHPEYQVYGRRSYFAPGP